MGGVRFGALLGASTDCDGTRGGADTAAYIKPYVKRGKNDASTQAAICEAMSRPDMRFVPIKECDQQAVLMLHKTRELLVKQRTMAVNACAATLPSSVSLPPGA